MVKYDDTDQPVKCSFCGKTQEMVSKLIAGPGVYICNECIELCNEIMGEPMERGALEELEKVPAPVEIKKILDDYVIGQDEAKVALAVAVYLSLIHI